MVDLDEMPSESNRLAVEMEDLKKLVATMAQLLVNQNQMQKAENSSEMASATLNAIESRMLEFVYCPEEGSTFERWWNRHEDIFMIDLKEWSEVKKTRLLIRHVTTSVERTFTEAIAPAKWTDMTLDQVKEKMLTLFGDNTSIFDRRRSMLDLKMSRENIEDVRVLAARVNQTVENAQVRDATIDEWKVLTFLHSLDLTRYSDVHLKMMQTAKQKGKDCKLDDLLSVYNDLSQLKKDSRMITDSSRDVNYVSERRSKRDQKDQKDNQKQRNSSSSSERTVLDRHTGCPCCGYPGHRGANCRYRSAKCYECGKQGHISRACKEKKVNTVMVVGVTPINYRIQVEIEGVETSTIVDTGSDISIISEEIWEQLGRPECKRDFGTVKCANGDDLRLIGRFCARVEYGGIAATDDVYVIHGRMNLLGKNFIKLLKLVKVRSPETKENIVKVECEVGSTPDHKGPETMQINLVKVEGAATERIIHQNERNSEKVNRDSPEATTRLKDKTETLKPITGNSQLEENSTLSDHRWNEIDEKSDFPSKDEKGAEEGRISAGNGAADCTPDDPGIDPMMTKIREITQVMEDTLNELDELNLKLERNLTEWNTGSSDFIDNSSPLSTTSSPHASLDKLTSTPQCDHHPTTVLEGKPHKKTIEGKPRKKKMNEGNPHKETKH